MTTRWLGSRPASRTEPGLEGAVEIARTGEIVHVIERRLFVRDVRRHFVGEVEACTDSALRVRGYLFVYDSSESAFTKKPELRIRIFPLDNRRILSLLPQGTQLEQIRYDHDDEGNLTLVDGADLELDISEFSTRE